MIFMYLQAKLENSVLEKGMKFMEKLDLQKIAKDIFALVYVDTINKEAPEKTKKKILFENLTPLFPTSRLTLEQGSGSAEKTFLLE